MFHKIPTLIVRAFYAAIQYCLSSTAAELRWDRRRFNRPPQVHDSVSRTPESDDDGYISQHIITVAFGSFTSCLRKHLLLRRSSCYRQTCPFFPLLLQILSLLHPSLLQPLCKFSICLWELAEREAKHVGVKLVSSLRAYAIKAKRFPNRRRCLKFVVMLVCDRNIINCLHMRRLAQLLYGRNKSLGSWVQKVLWNRLIICLAPFLALLVLLGSKTSAFREANEP